MAAPVETKVQASTAAAAVSGLALWALGHYVFKGSVPDVVASWVYVLVPGIVTFAAGYLAKHAGRPAATVTVPAPVGAAAQKTLIPPAQGQQPKRGQDISPEPDPPMDYLAPPAVPPAAPE